MGLDSAIGWCTHTWNPWHGCRKVSRECKFCYMFRDKARYGQDPTKVVRSKTTFNAPLKWSDPAMVFTCSWSDFFIEEADEWREAAWNIIRSTPHLTYQILTKRPERIADHLPADWGDGWANVWLGVSAGAQEFADERIPYLMQVPARVRWVSVEPLLADLSFRWARWDKWKPDLRRLSEPGAESRDGLASPINELDGLRMLDWIVVGGESGPERQEMDMDAFTKVVKQCQQAKVPVFVKQDSALHSGRQGRIPDELWLKQFPVQHKATVAA